MRLLIYTDCVYRSDGASVYGEIAFSQFLSAFAEQVDALTIVGRLDPVPGVSHYRLDDSTQFLAVPHYASTAHPVRVVWSLLRSGRRFWRTVGQADVVWLFGPYAHAIVLALLGLARRRPVVLGVRQDFPVYVRSRRPGRRWLHLAADLLEGSWRLLARRLPVVVVGPQLAHNYRNSGQLQEISVSLISEADVEAGRKVQRDYAEGPLELLSVGRIDHEKNPLLLADVLAALRALDGRWRMSICGDGPLKGMLQERLTELGLAEHARLLGYLPVDEGLMDLYRSAHVFLHVSWTEGMPQVLLEAFAAGVPVVATAVGGVAAAARGAALLIEPGDPQGACAAAVRLVGDAELRGRLVAEGFQRAAEHTLSREVERVIDLMRAVGTPGAVTRARAGSLAAPGAGETP